MTSQDPSGQPTRAYLVEEAAKGVVVFLVYARTAAEARATYVERGEAIDVQIHPAGVRPARPRRGPAMTIPLPPDEARELDPKVVERGARAMHNRLHVVVQNLDWDWDDSGQITQELAEDAFAWGVEQSGLPAQLAEWKRRALASESEVQRLARELGARRDRLGWDTWGNEALGTAEWAA